MTIFHGAQAVRRAEEVSGKVYGYIPSRVLMLEGFADSPYKDIKGILTNGAGQTGEWLNRSFDDALAHHVDRVCRRIPIYPMFPEYLKAELLQAEYRGDLGHSPKACGLINAHDYAAAAVEFLNNAEYRVAPSQIRRRMEAVAAALRLYDLVGPI